MRCIFLRIIDGTVAFHYNFLCRILLRMINGSVAFHYNFLRRILLRIINGTVAFHYNFLCVWIWVDNVCEELRRAGLYGVFEKMKAKYPEFVKKDLKFLMAREKEVESGENSIVVCFFTLKDYYQIFLFLGARVAFHSFTASHSAPLLTVLYKRRFVLVPVVLRVLF